MIKRLCPKCKLKQKAKGKDYCEDCKKEYDKNWRKQHRGYMGKYNKNWRKQHPNYMKKYNKEHYQKRKISYGENVGLLKEKINERFPKISIDVGTLKKKYDTLKEKGQHLEKQELIEKEDNAEKEFERSLKEIEKSETPNLLEKYFFIIKQFTKMVGTEKATALFVEGACGTGKSINCIKALQEINRKFIVISSHLSPLELYSFLYKYREGYTILFDDCSLLDNKTSQAILKSATYSPTGIRILRYMTSTPRLKVPSVYTFKSTIIFCLNKLPNLNEDFKAVLDRCLHYKLEIPYKDLIKIMSDLTKLPYHKLELNERKEIFNFIKENSDETCDISLRVLFKIYSFYEYDETKWKRLGLEILKPNEELQLVKKLIKEHNTIKSACIEFIEKGLGSRAKFFRLKRKIY